MPAKHKIAILLILLSGVVWLSCSKAEVDIQVTITKVTDLSSLGSPYCQYTYAPLDTTHKVKTNNIFLDKCGKYNAGDVVGIPSYHFIK